MLKREFYIDVFYISAHRAYTRAKIPSMVSRAALTRARANITIVTHFYKNTSRRESPFMHVSKIMNHIRCKFYFVSVAEQYRIQRF
jgi:hypothetical protein